MKISNVSSPTPNKKMRILGIDPGNSRIGFGVIDATPALKLVAYNTMEVTDLLDLAQQFSKLLDEHRPDLVSIETLFFSNNQKTAMRVAQARGVLLLKTLERGIEITELGPMQVKMAVTSYGKSDKKAVAKMVRLLLKMDALTGYDDASDALAIAIAAANCTKLAT